jgi:hypothetical protein
MACFRTRELKSAFATKAPHNEPKIDTRAGTNGPVGECGRPEPGMDEIPHSSCDFRLLLRYLTQTA